MEGHLNLHVHSYEEKQKLNACLKIRRETEIDADLRITKNFVFEEMAHLSPP